MYSVMTKMAATCGGGQGGSTSRRGGRGRGSRGRGWEGEGEGRKGVGRECMNANTTVSKCNECMHVHVFSVSVCVYACTCVCVHVCLLAHRCVVLGTSLSFS